MDADPKLRTRVERLAAMLSCPEAAAGEKANAARALAKLYDDRPEAAVIPLGCEVPAFVTRRRVRAAVGRALAAAEAAQIVGRPMGALLLGVAEDLFGEHGDGG